MNWDALVLTLQIASASTVLSLLVGVPIAWWLARDNAWYRIVLSAAVMVPMVLPPTVLGYYLLQMFGRRSVLGEILENWLNMSLVFHWTGAALAAFVVSAPFLIRAAQTGFESTDRSYSEAARTLGRSEVAIFFLISIPLAGRAILAGGALALARGLGEFGATLMVAGNVPGKTQTMSIAIYDAVQTGKTSEANVLAITLSVAAIGLLTIVGLIGRNRLRL